MKSLALKWLEDSCIVSFMSGRYYYGHSRLALLGVSKWTRACCGGPLAAGYRIPTLLGMLSMRAKMGSLAKSGPEIVPFDTQLGHVLG